MDNINVVFAENLKQLRERRKLSLDAVARLSGVSKSMLGQIERGEVNPTIGTVWKITNGLKISFSELLSRPEAEYEVVEAAAVQPLLEDGGRYRNHLLFGVAENRNFEISRIELNPGASLRAEPHPAGTQEFCTVFSGVLRVLVSGKTLVAGAGGALRFVADRAHEYRNDGEGVCRVSMVVHYPV